MKFALALTAALSLSVLCGCELLQLISAGAGECPGAEQSMGTMTADIDGVAFVSCITQGSNDSDVLAVTGQEYKDGIVPFQLQVTVTEAAVGSFALGDTEGSGRYTESVDATYATIIDTATGTIDVTTYDDASAAGTFSFMATDGSATVEITNGVFDVAF